MYSDSVQQTGVGIGIPMQKTAVEKWKEESVLESDLTLLSTCLSSLDTVCRERDVLRASIANVLPALFADEMSVEDAVDSILNYIPTQVSKKIGKCETHKQELCSLYRNELEINRLN